MFTVVFDGFEDTTSEKALLLSLDNGGQLRDLMGHEVEDDGLRSILRQGNAMRACSIKIKIEHEEQTTLAILADVLAKFKALSDPQRETVIILHLEKLRQSGRGRSDEGDQGAASGEARHEGRRGL